MTLHKLVLTAGVLFISSLRGAEDYSDESSTMANDGTEQAAPSYMGYLSGTYTGSTSGSSLTTYTFHQNGRYEEDLWFAETGSIYNHGTYGITDGTMTIHWNGD